MEKICEECNTKNDLYAEKCSKCGYVFYKNKKPVNKNKRKKSKKYYIIFGLIIPTIIVSIYFVLLYAYLYGLENYNSKVYLDNYLSLFENKSYEEIIKFNDFEETYFNRKTEFISYINSKYGNVIDSVKIIKNNSKSNNNKHVYNVQFGNGKINEFVVNRTKNKKLLYFNTWKVDKSEINFDYNKINISCPKNLKLYLNEQLVTKDYIKECKDIELYNNIIQKDYKKPQIINYNINDLLKITTLKAYMPTGEECIIKKIDEENYVVKPVMSDKMKGEILPLAEEIAKKYAAYIAEDCTFKELRNYLYESTKFYETLLQFYNGWFPLHNSHSYEDKEIESVDWYSNNNCSVNIKFNYNITYKNNRERTYKVAYKIYFIKIDNKWLVSNITNY